MCTHGQSAHLKPWTAQDVITHCSSHSCLTDPNSFVLWKTLGSGAQFSVGRGGGGGRGGGNIVENSMPRNFPAGFWKTTEFRAANFGVILCLQNHNIYLRDFFCSRLNVLVPCFGRSRVGGPCPSQCQCVGHCKMACVARETAVCLGTRPVARDSNLDTWLRCGVQFVVCRFVACEVFAGGLVLLMIQH